jgi:hypothetical protein
VKNILNFVRIVLKQPTEQTGKLSKYNFTPSTFFSRLLLQFTCSTLQQLHFFRLHAIDLAPLFEDKPFIMAQLAGIKETAARCLNLTCMAKWLQLR